MSQPASSDASQPAAWHVMITLQWSAGSATRYASYAIVAMIGPGTTRSDTFASALAAARGVLHAPADAAVLFFSLEPECLTATPAGDGPDRAGDGGAGS